MKRRWKVTKAGNQARPCRGAQQSRRCAARPEAPGRGAGKLRSGARSQAGLRRGAQQSRPRALRPPTTRGGAGKLRQGARSQTGLSRGALQSRLDRPVDGRFGAGWNGYEYRWNHKDAAPRRLIAPFPVWKGEDLKGKRIIVYEEQGLGDVIQFLRYLPLLSSLGASVTFLVCAPMHRLLQPFAPTIRLVDETCRGRGVRFPMRVVELPLAFGTTLGSNSREHPLSDPGGAAGRPLADSASAHLVLGSAFAGKAIR